jgi:Zn-dependent peptidase ImmA (M78 family)
MRAQRVIDPDDAEQKRVEIEANWFAAAFLMAEDTFKASWHSYGGNLAVIAEKFGVTLRAATIRRAQIFRSDVSRLDMIMST